MFSKLINQCRTNPTPENQYNPKPVWGTEQVDGQALSLFRIALSLVLLFDLFFIIIPYWEFVFSADGVLMSAELGRNILWSLFTYSDNPLFHTGLLTIYGLSLFGFLIGYKPRLSAFLAFILYTALWDKNIDAHSNAEKLASLLLLWSAFLPTARYWSIEAALTNQDKDQAQITKTRNRPWPIIPILAIKLQIVVVYLHSGLYKLGSNDWTSGQALHYVSQDQFFTASRLADLIHQIPPDIQFYMAWSVILFQLAFTLMIYSPIWRNLTRALAILGAAAMHFSFIILLQIHMFPYICFCYLILLIPDGWFNKALKKRRTRLSKIQIYYDPDCGFCRTTASIFREFCLGATASLKPSSNNPTAHTLLQKHNSWVVFGADGQTYLKWHAVSYVMKQSPIFWIIGTLTDLKPLHKPMEAIYNLIGNNRHTFSALTKPILHPIPERYPERTAQYICLFLMAVTFTYTTLELPQIKHQTPEKITITADRLGLKQRWAIFANPGITSDTYGIDITATDKNDRPIDTKPYTDQIYTRDAKGYFKFPNHRILSYMINIFPKDSPRHRKGFVRYLCYKTAQNKNPIEKITLNLLRHSNRLGDDTYKKTDHYNCSDLLKAKEDMLKN